MVTTKMTQKDFNAISRLTKLKERLDKFCDTCFLDHYIWSYKQKAEKSGLKNIDYRDIDNILARYSA